MIIQKIIIIIIVIIITTMTSTTTTITKPTTTPPPNTNKKIRNNWDNSRNRACSVHPTMKWCILYQTHYQPASQPTNIHFVVKAIPARGGRGCQPCWCGGAGRVPSCGESNVSRPRWYGPRDWRDKKGVTRIESKGERERERERGGREGEIKYVHK